MFAVGSGKGNCRFTFKESVEAELPMQGEQFGTTAQQEMLSVIEPLTGLRVEHRRTPTSENFGSLEEGNLKSFSCSGLSGSNTSKSAADNGKRGQRDDKR